MTTALCLSRNCYKPVVFDSGAYRNAGAPHMHMMPTWDHKNPSEYHKAARAELEERYGNFVQFVDRNVVDIEKTANEEDFVAEDGTGENFHCLNYYGYEDRGQELVGVLAIELMAQAPPITNSLFRSALQLSKKFVVYTNGSEDVGANLQGLTNGLGDRVSYDSRRITRLLKEPTASQVTIEFDGGDRVTRGFLVHGKNFGGVGGFWDLCHHGRHSGATRIVEL